MRTLFLMLIIVFVSGTATILAQKGQDKIKYGDVYAKLMSEPDSDGDVWFAVKVEVRNDSDKDQKVKVTVRGIDSEGFEVVDLTMENDVKAGDRMVFTDSTFTSNKSYQSIVKWEVEE